ncbi:short chain dehydrogenase/reductase [Penicillium subrubescens]|uniref:15-hydroxyprostaglandin dehydrogenase [NAD(+)] n=1 Tax=Penicillium subrubescens TaxID=1316194 RepID=A0A1Q5UM43_9EURO|nr:short chain dehydrogenase/reductase [Penicillium subrubescens]KAJ5895897.1 short chain dehydrogenase/reductase [Penicillium subrubescens]OKP13565.1 15-hydroxyprostaglandin dehydrogenase [NAD(+)] [Penicillium subrubescens]
MRSIVVTGGASGIGLGITRHFITQPDTHITILDVNATSGSQVLQQLQTEFPSGSVSFEQCDVSSWDSQATAFEKIYAEKGRIDIVFANAGISKEGNLLPAKGEAGPVKPNLTTMNVNLVGVIYTVNLATYYMYKNATSDPSASNGLIVCTASNAGLYPFPVAPLYGSTKSGVIGLVRSLARRLEQDKIRINALAPAVIETNIAPSADLFKPMIITPMSTATKAVAQFVADESLTGKIAEVHGEHVTFAEPPAYVDEDTGKNIETFWNLGYA